MRHRLYGGTVLLAAAVVLAGPGAARAQSDTTYAYPGEPSEKVPLPLGNAGGHGFYTFFELMYLTQTWGLGDQTVAYRGLIDSTGGATGVPGTYIGSGTPALTTSMFGRSTFAPGMNLGIGYKTDEGISVYASYLYTSTRSYNAGATSATPFSRSNTSLSDTYLTSQVFNFPSEYAGVPIKTAAEAAGGGNIFYGIWDGAGNMEIQFNQWFQQAEIGGRVPLLQTEYSRVYGLGGVRFDWIMERFKWRTVAYDVQGTTGLGGQNTNSRSAADYNNTLSQRMYGPFAGCGHEVYLGKRFSLSLDLTGAILVDVVKERAKYELEDRSIQNKRSRDDINLVPSFTGALNLWWYPIEGVQVRAGYNAYTFFNTKYMQDPIGFNYGAIDPVYSTSGFRIIHGINLGVGLFF